MSKVGEALLLAALENHADATGPNEKRSHIKLQTKSANPRQMVLESVRFPKGKGKRSIESDDENLMNIQEKNSRGKTKLCYTLHPYES